MGAFASMAQNDYGIFILGAVAGLFSFLFLLQLIQLLQEKGKTSFIDLIELISLVILSSVLAMRVFYIRFQFVEIVFGLAGLMLIGVYIRKLLHAWKILGVKSQTLAWLVSLFYGCIILYVFSMTIVPFVPQLAEPSGGAAFALLIFFIVISVMKKSMIVEGEKTSSLKYVTRFKDRSVLLILLFLLFTGYMGLTKIGALPKMYSDEFPQVYFDLVNQAESGKEKPVNGKYKHDEFKEVYDRFVERNIKPDRK
jgi:hypothetical protein